MQKIKSTPMMEQWITCKKKAKDALVFFRLGDFYEAFYEDASVISKELDLTFTKRQEIPMCGVPYHTCDVYVDRLIAKGFKVAIVEQMEDPKKVKGIVKRDIVRIVTPGTVVNSNLLTEKSNNYFVCISKIGSIFGLATIDLTTSFFKIIEIENKLELFDELYKIQPKEILISKKFAKTNDDLISNIKLSFSLTINEKEDWHFDHKLSYETLKSHFKVFNLDGFGLSGMNSAITAGGAAFAYLKDDLSFNLDHIKNISSSSKNKHLMMNYSCMKNLEILDTNSSNKKNTLLKILDKTNTAMGGRLLANFIKYPLMDIDLIKKRQESIKEFYNDPFTLSELKNGFSNIRDIERLNMKISSNYATPRDLISLKVSLQKALLIKDLLKNYKSPLIKSDILKIQDLSHIVKTIDVAVMDDAPIKITDGNIFKDGYNKELDELRLIRKDSKQWIANYQNKLREDLNIKTLKVGFTRVFGYYIEVSRAQSINVPQHFTRRQTLVNQERFISEELKVFENKILTSEERIKAIENELYNKIREEIALYFKEIDLVAKAIARIDVFYSFAMCAKDYNLICPNVNTSPIIDIKNGRHLLIENTLKSNEFIANDTYLDNENDTLFIITGPNMAGKSTYIRQVALIVIMAQIGSFVPAKEANIGIVDKIFSRIGANDDLTRGQSTFMVEMSETANILNTATEKSLIILDEIGRGTSTYDGISIAWAVAKYLLTVPNKRAKTLFATHYSELTELEKLEKGAVNYNISVAEVDHGIVFLHKIVKGGTDKSYGIHVAKLAGLPYEAIKIAENRLLELEKNAPIDYKKRRAKLLKNENQFSLFDAKPSAVENPIIDEIKKLDINNLSPVDALQKLLSIQKKIK
jgi:DNA mismatch repair protein MutS